MSTAVEANYFLRDGYVHRPEPQYFVDAVSDHIIWQPDVYVEAIRVAGAVGARRIIDVGCGQAGKLAPIYPTLEIIGIDFGPNLDVCRSRYPFGTWRETDLDADTPLPVSEEELADAVLINSDVIEHVKHPEVLLGKLRGALDVASALLISTPERERTWGADHNGPPPNPAHVREWTQAEFGALLAHMGFDHGEVGLTRSTDHEFKYATILGRLFRTDELAARALSGRAATSAA